MPDNVRKPGGSPGASYAGPAPRGLHSGAASGGGRGPSAAPMAGGQGTPGGGGPGSMGGDRNVVAEVKARLAKGKTLAEVPIDDLVQAAEDLGKHLVSVRLNTTQIRKFLTQVNKLSADFRKNRTFERERVVLLKPKLAYAAGQHDAVRPLADVLVEAIDRVISDRDYERFARFVEAVVAYHRFHGGKDS